MSKGKGSNFITFILILLIIVVIVAICGFFIYSYKNIDNMQVGTTVKNIIEEINSTNDEEKEKYSIDNGKTNQEVKNPLEQIQSTYGEDMLAENKENTYYYNQLDKNAKEIYDGLYKNIDNMKDGTYKINFASTFNELLHQSNGQEILNIAYQSAWNAFSVDNPQVFYINPSKIYLNIEKVTRGTNVTYNVYLKNADNDTYLSDGFQSRAQVESAITMVETIKNNVLNNINGTNYQKMKQVHDWLVDNIEYDESLSRDNIRNIYGALEEKMVVCEGYTKAFKYYMDELKIPCVIVYGTGTNSEGKTESHSWNYVKINESWYAIDVTWDDPIIKGNGKLTNKLRYEYFCKGSNKFNKNHISDGKFSDSSITFNYPELSQEDYN